MERLFAKKRYIILFIGPALFVYTVFGLVPLIRNVYLSFFKTDLLSDSVFIGFKNYINLFHDQFFRIAVRNALVWTFFCYLAQIGGGLLLAYILFQKIKGTQFFQTVFFMPSVICGTAIGLLWTFIYHPQYGLLNSAMKAVGLGKYCHSWLADEKTVIPALIVICMWQFIGYHMVIQLSGMRNIDPSLFEAASIDGASRWQQFTKIMLPLLKNILKIDSVLIVTSCLKTYDIVAVTTSGGPSHASEMLATYMYVQGFRSLKFGYSSAIAVVLLVFCFAFTTLIKGDFTVQVSVLYNDEIGILRRNFNRLVNDINHLVSDIYNEKMLKQQAQLRMLQMQINPHFLYNTLDTINWLAQSHGAEDVAEVSRSLGYLMHFSLADQELISLEEEMDAVEHYMLIQRYRHGEQLKVEIEVEEEALYEKVPRHIILPLIENAIEHGLKNKIGEKQIQITGEVQQDVVIMHVSDNGVGMAPEEIERALDGSGQKKKRHMSIGLNNVNRRIVLRYGEAYALQIHSVVGEGTTVEVRIPCRIVNDR